MKIRPEFVGSWRITEMSEWDLDFIDLVAPGHLTIKADGTGRFAFGAIESEIDCRIERIGKEARLAFSFSGWDEGDEVNGRGWGTINGANMEGWFCFHLGDESTFKARKKNTKPISSMRRFER